MIHRLRNDFCWLLVGVNYFETRATLNTTNNFHSTDWLNFFLLLCCLFLSACISHYFILLVSYIYIYCPLSLNLYECAVEILLISMNYDCYILRDSVDIQFVIYRIRGLACVGIYFFFYLECFCYYSFCIILFFNWFRNLYATNSLGKNEIFCVQNLFPSNPKMYCRFLCRRRTHELLKFLPELHIHSHPGRSQNSEEKKLFSTKRHTATRTN